MESNQVYSTPNNFTSLLNSQPFLNDLNETHPIYDLTLSQYQSTDPIHVSPSDGANYEETPFYEGNIDTRIARGSKKAQRADNFNTEEDKLLVSAWLNNSIDPVVGTDQTKCQFWKKVTKYYAENKTWDKDRSEKSLVNRWNKISAMVSRFCGIHSQIEHLRRSGNTEQDKVIEAKEVFWKEEGHPFQLDHCWNILRFQHKWMNEHKRIEDKRWSKVNCSKTSKSINLDDDNMEDPQPANLKRPMGRKAAKESIKKAKTKNQVSENDDESSKIRLEFEELRARRIENENIRAEQLHLLLATEQKHVELKEKKLELEAINQGKQVALKEKELELEVRNQEKQAALREKELGLEARNQEKQAALREKEIEFQDRSEEDRIMAMDTSGMSQIQVEYFERRRKEIFAKQARRVENI